MTDGKIAVVKKQGQKGYHNWNVVIGDMFIEAYSWKEPALKLAERINKAHAKALAPIIQAAKDEALEQAAKIADEWEAKAYGNESYKIGREHAAHGIAKKIRALKSALSAPGGGKS